LLDPCGAVFDRSDADLRVVQACPGAVRCGAQDLEQRLAQIRTIELEIADFSNRRQHPFDHPGAHHRALRTSRRWGPRPGGPVSIILTPVHPPLSL
jgi:hypothetical protein